MQALAGEGVDLRGWSPNGLVNQRHPCLGGEDLQLTQLQVRRFSEDSRPASLDRCGHQRYS